MYCDTRRIEIYPEDSIKHPSCNHGQMLVTPMTVPGM